jgi:HD-GYP domain-containing protein (c-di-GMP phosphodiesterase class II)
MKTMKNALKKQEQYLSTIIIIPLMIFIVILSILMWTNHFDARLYRINSSSEAFVKELVNEFILLESTFNQKMSFLLEQGYDQSFDENTINSIREELLATESDFPVASINVYRLTETYVVYDTDFPSALNTAFSKEPELVRQLSDLSPGDVYYSSLASEPETGDVRLYAYIRLPDRSFFGVGVKFGEIKERAIRIMAEVFSDQDLSIKNPGNYTPAELLLFEESLEKNLPVYHIRSLTELDLYVKKATRYGSYRFIITTRFDVPLYILITVIVLSGLFIGLRLFVTQNIEKISGNFSHNLERLEHNVQNFQLDDFSVNPEDINSDIKEIDAISKAFLKMRDDIINSYEELSAMNQEIEATYMENQNLLKKVEAFLNMPDYLLYLNNTERFLLRSFERILSLVDGMDLGYVAFYDEGEYKFLDFVGIDMELINSIPAEPETYALSEEDQHYEAVALVDYAEGEYLTRYREIPEIREFQADIAQVLYIPISTENSYLGDICLFTQRKSGNRMTDDDYRIAAFFANYLKGYLMIKEVSTDEAELQKETIYSLIRLLEQHDPYTKGHSESVAKLAADFATYLKLPEQTVQSLYWSGIVHDMGKILIPNSILNKPARLSKEEFAIIQNHPEYAWDVLKKNKNMEHIAIFIKHHHEKYDGSGYPDKLKGDQIPFESRILTLADSWDAMTAERVYKQGMSAEDALEEIQRNAGVQFDPELVTKWIQFIQSD